MQLPPKAAKAASSLSQIIPLTLSDYRRCVAVCLCALLLALGGCTEDKQQPSANDADSNNMLTRTYQGTLLGQTSPYDNSVAVFRGIPYAEPPLGDLRWKPPHSPKPWSGTRPAERFATACVQATDYEEFVWGRPAFNTSEDCLYLNVWHQKQAQQQPVMVWFHGGAHTGGSGQEKIFDGTFLAQQGVVVVTLNYRLGPFGFLAHPWLQEESSHHAAGNYGLLDKIAALNWIRDNIDQFGGNPDNITVFGQSAGSQSVCALMVSPLARGLFHKAIGQSASCLSLLPQRDEAGTERGTNLVEQTGATDLEALRKLPAEALMDAANASGWATGSRIVIDGWVLPEQPLALFEKGLQADIPLMTGTLANEGHLLFPLNEALDREGMVSRLSRMASPQQIEALLQVYETEVNQSDGLAWREISTDIFMSLSARLWAALHTRAGQPAFLYFMDHKPPAFRLYHPEKPDLNLEDGPRSAGAYHSGDLAYVFGTHGILDAGWAPEDAELSSTLMTYWTNFAKSGNPNHSTQPAWQPYQPNNHTTLYLSESQTASVDTVRRAKLDLLQDILRPQN